MTLDPDYKALLLEWAERIVHNHLAEISEHLADNTEPLITQHRKDTP